jgi:hypothetical protein
MGHWRLRRPIKRQLVLFSTKEKGAWDRSFGYPELQGTIGGESRWYAAQVPVRSPLHRNFLLT